MRVGYIGRLQPFLNIVVLVCVFPFFAYFFFFFKVFLWAGARYLTLFGRFGVSLVQKPILWLLYASCAWYCITLCNMSYIQLCISFVPFLKGYQGGALSVQWGFRVCVFVNNESSGMDGIASGSLLDGIWPWATFSERYAYGWPWGDQSGILDAANLAVWI